MSKAIDIDKNLASLFEAERRVRDLHDTICDAEPEAALDAIARVLPKALAEDDELEAALRLDRLAMLLGEFEGPRAVDLLVDVLTSDLPDVRATAGEQLEALAYDRFKDVAKGIERALERLPLGSPALAELPYVIAEIPEPGVSKLLVKFLQHDDPDAVAAAIEVGVELGDPGLVEHLEKLRDDERSVEMTDENEEAAEVTIGELVEDAIDILSGDDEDDDGPPSSSRRH
jgi:HEAT repeat protein